MIRIPVSKPDLTGNEEGYVLEAVRSGWVSSGPFVERAEAAVAELCGARHAALVTSGTAALHLALMALDVRAGDEVLVPALTYVAAANACRYVGAEPVFVDVDEETWCINPVQAAERITRRTRGIIAVHSYGHPADMDALNRLAAVHGLWVVEDAAEAHGARYKGRPVGALGRVGVLSFYANKIVTSGEGGAVITNDEQLDKRLRTLRGQGVDPDRRYWFPVVGYNFRMTDLQAAVLCAQLERFDHLVAERQRVCDRYARQLGPLTPEVVLQRRAAWANTAPWMFSALFVKKEIIAAALAERGIETRPLFIPLNTLPPYRERAAEVPVSDILSQSGLNLPTYPQLSNAEVDEICGVIKGCA